ncbi:hypothetical protein A5785_16095 [Gordonia sp. 852002-50395_SCH5434458]|nr:hypothetical protein A5785_16095 [Gordonia sp. 852002-50395_SCH5434458]
MRPCVFRVGFGHLGVQGVECRLRDRHAGSVRGVPGSEVGQQLPHLEQWCRVESVVTFPARRGGLDQAGLGEHP